MSIMQRISIFLKKNSDIALYSYESMFTARMTRLISYEQILSFHSFVFIFWLDALLRLYVYMFYWYR